MIDAEISAHQYEVDRLVRVAVEAGVPKRQVGILGLGTSDYKTLKESLNRTEGVVTITHAETDPLAVRYSLTEDGDLRVTLNDEELKKAMYDVNYDEKMGGPAPTFADFTTEDTDRGTRLKAISPTETNNWERNPAVYWTYEREAEALAWYAEHTMEAAA
jgi:hypothetical protein